MLAMKNFCFFLNGVGMFFYIEPDQRRNVQYSNNAYNISRVLPTHAGGVSG